MLSSEYFNMHTISLFLVFVYSFPWHEILHTVKCTHLKYMFTEFWQSMHRNNTNLHQDRKIIPLCQPQLAGQETYSGARASVVAKAPNSEEADSDVSPWWLDKPPSGQQACLRWGRVFWSHICEQFPHSCKATSILKQTDPPEAAQLRALCSEHPYTHHPPPTTQTPWSAFPYLCFIMSSSVQSILLFWCISPNAGFLFLFLLEYEVKVKLLSHVRLFAAPWVLRPWDSPGKNTGVGCHFLLQGIFPTQGSNPGLPHCRQML